MYNSIFIVFLEEGFTTSHLRSHAEFGGNILFSRGYTVVGNNREILIALYHNMYEKGINCNVSKFIHSLNLTIS